MKECQIIYNPQCSKCRQSLALLEEKGFKPQVIEYLNGELTRELLTSVITTLNVHPKELLRTKEEEFKSLRLDLENAEEVIDAILKHPKILERPIVIQGKKAVIGRPPEKILDIL
jgi:arsenate reductase